MQRQETILIQTEPQLELYKVAIQAVELGGEVEYKQITQRCLLVEPQTLLEREVEVVVDGEPQLAMVKAVVGEEGVMLVMLADPVMLVPLVTQGVLATQGRLQTRLQ